MKVKRNMKMIMIKIKAQIKKRTEWVSFPVEEFVVPYIILLSTRLDMVGIIESLALMRLEEEESRK